MSRDQTLRQVTLASYGTLFLQRQLDLEQWYRHGIFWEARFQFRDPASRRLIADDFTLWLGQLREQGALRLSMHIAADLPDAELLGVVWVERMLIVHFANRHQCWALGEEQTQWRNNGWNIDADDGAQRYPQARYYAGTVDCYWLVEDAAGVPQIPETHWKKLTSAIQIDLNLKRNLAGAKSLPHYAPYYVSMRCEVAWAKLPVIPHSPKLALPHQLLAMLDSERATFDNDTHPKNENSPYQFLSEQQAAEVDHWGIRLDSWIAEVQLRAANELRWSGASGGDSSLVRWVNPPASPSILTADPAVNNAPHACIGSAATTTAIKPSRGLGGLAWLFAFIGLTLFVLACANIISIWL